MTRCMRNKVNLKSSVYNQTGQNYYEQLAAYNSMSLHLRRILSARNVVDTKNKRYISAKRDQLCRAQETGSKRICSRSEEIDNVIDILAYDTHHHPVDVLRMNLNPKHLHCCNCKLLSRQKLSVCCGGTCYEESDQIDRSQRSVTKFRRTSPTQSPKHKKFISEFICKKESKSARETYIINPLTYSRQRYEKGICIPCMVTRGDSQEITDRRSVSSTSKSDDYFDDKPASNPHLYQKENEGKKYIKFVYDITKEIMQRGLYTDKELRDVFKKHINQNKGILNMNKMLYEIYQLKISLNILEDSDTDEELEDLVYAQKLLTVSEIRPPTPPKVLDENKVVEKLKYYQNGEGKSSNLTGKSVTLVDANPDLLVTERDVLTSLMEEGISPAQAQHICKALLHKSRDTALADAVQVGMEVSQSLSNPKPRVTAENPRDSAADNSPPEREVGSLSSNPAFTQDATADTKERMESQAKE